MDIELVRRICLARHLYELGASSLRSGNDLHLFAAVNLLQDAVEAFLIAVGEHVGAAIDQRTTFDKYFVQIDEKIKPKELPFKLKLLRLNRIRVDSKHYGIQPARDECDRLSLSVREFFEEASQAYLGVSFSTISALDLLDYGDAKNFLVEARSALDTGDNEACVIACRKALYLEIESSYDISAYRDGKPLGLLAGFTNAPFYACSKEYIDKNVRDPTDYIVLDHSRIDQDLLTKRVETTDFWNVWRLTPEVYKTKDGQWVVKHDFDKLDKTLLSDKGAYIFSTTVDILLALHTNRKRARNSEYGAYFCELRSDHVPVYEKADTRSRVIGQTPDGLYKIDTDFRVIGLDGDGPYWHVHHVEKGLILIGYIHNDYIA